MSDLLHDAGTWTPEQQMEIAARLRRAEEYALRLTEKLEELLRENMILRKQA